MGQLLGSPSCPHYPTHALEPACWCGLHHSGVLALTALLFKMEEANLASPAKA